MSTFLRQAFLPLREDEFLRFSPFPVGAGFSTAVDIVCKSVYMKGRWKRGEAGKVGREEGRKGREGGGSDESVKL
jgi:hypothetical protein